MFIVEAFQPRRLLTPLQALQERERKEGKEGKEGGEEEGGKEGGEEEGGEERKTRVGVLDLNGHFACCVKLGDGRLVVLNTTDGSYIRREICGMADVVLHSR